MSTQPAGAPKSDLGSRLSDLEDVLRSYTMGEVVPAAKYTIGLAIVTGGTADIDTAIPAGVTLKVIDAHLIKTDQAAGANASTIQVKNAGNAITDAMPLINDAVGDVERALSVAPAQQTLVGPATLRITRTQAGGGNTAADVYLECLIMATA